MNKRKVFFFIAALIFVGLFFTGSSFGALVSSYYTPPLSPGIPQILVSDVTTTGNFVYNKVNNTFDMNSQAIVILFPSISPPPPFSFYTLTGKNYSTDINVKIDLDNGTLNPNGFYVGNLGTLNITLTSGSVKIQAQNYNAPTTLLAGNIWAFGYYDADSGKTTIFDFQVTNLSGALVDNHGWPANPNATSYLYAWSDNSWPGNFLNDFTIEKAKGKIGPTDSPPVPTPATLILLGSGMSIIGFIRFRKKR